MDKYIELHEKLINEQESALAHSKPYGTFVNDDFINGTYRSWRSVQGEIENRIREIQSELYKLDYKGPTEPKLLIDTVNNCIDAAADNASAHTSEYTDSECQLESDLKVSKANLNFVNFIKNNVKVIEDNIVIKEYNTEDETQEFVLFLTPEEAMTIADALSNYSYLVSTLNKTELVQNYTVSEDDPKPEIVYQEVTKQLFDQGWGDDWEDEDEEEESDDTESEDSAKKDDNWDDPTIREYQKL